MVQILSKTSEQAVLALLFLAKYSDKEEIDISVIAKSLDISRHSLGKILQTLVRAEIVHSKKGPVGGFKLKKSPDKISLMEIIEVFHENYIFNRCIIGFPKCDPTSPCSLHKEWENVCENIKNIFKESTIGDLIKQPEFMEKINIVEK